MNELKIELPDTTNLKGKEINSDDIKQLLQVIKQNYNILFAIIKNIQKSLPK